MEKGREVEWKMANTGSRFLFGLWQENPDKCNDTNEYHKDHKSCPGLLWVD